MRNDTGTYLEQSSSAIESEIKSMVQQEYPIRVGMGLVTCLPRWLPIHFLSGRELLERFTEWLDLIPAALLSALVMPELLTEGDPRHLDLLRPHI